MSRLRKPVALYDDEGRLYRVFESFAHAAGHLDVPAPGLHRAVSQPFLKAAGYFVRRVEGDVPDTIEVVLTPCRERIAKRAAVKEGMKKERRDAQVVIEVDPLTRKPTGREFKNSSEAARHYGVSRQMISLVLVQPLKHKTVRGHGLAYKID